jgi:hypothetical protein
MTMLAEPTMATAPGGNSYYFPDRSDIEAVQDTPTLARGWRLPRRGMQFQVAGAHADWLPAIIARFNHLLTLERGWDGEGAEQVILDAVRWAVHLVVNAAALGTPAPSIVPDAAGDLQIEWHLGDLDVEIATQPQGRYEVLFEDRQTGEDWEYEGGLRSGPLHAALLRIAQRSRSLG